MTNTKEYMKQWRNNNKEKVKSYRKKWEINNPDKMQQCRQSWKDKHPNLRKYYREYQRKRLGCLPRDIWLKKVTKPLDQWTVRIGNKKLRARQLLIKAVRLKRIIKPKQCSKCNKTAILDGHHTDYDKWWIVIWLCRQCHNEIHNPKGSCRYYNGRKD